MNWCNRVAAVLFVLATVAGVSFAKSSEISRWHSRCQIRFIKVQGVKLGSGEKYNVISDESVQGNIFELWLKSWENLRPYLAFKTEFGSNAKFEQKYTYPEDACKSGQFSNAQECFRCRFLSNAWYSERGFSKRRLSAI